MGKAYKTITEVFDFGPFITTILLETGVSLSGATIHARDFRVHITREAIGEDHPWPALFGRKVTFPMDGEINVTGAAITDENGTPDPDGSCIALSISVDPRNTLNSIVRFNGAFNAFVTMKLVITQSRDIAGRGGIAPKGVYDLADGNRIRYGELLKEEIHSDPQISLKYVYYKPEAEEHVKYPLIIWLHGGGEGGTDTLVSAIGNKAVNFMTPEIQQIFGGKAYFLSPQCPTIWMDDGQGGFLDTKESIYVEPLERLIAEFIQQHSDIDRQRIYIGGDSNGGYMTLRMILQMPDRYAAGFPICEGYKDEWIGKEEEEQLKKVPLWFTAAKNDTVLPIRIYAEPTYLRLKKLGCEVHFSLFDKVIDTKNQYPNEDGSPYEYPGHWSWIPMLNNECRLDYDGNAVLLNGKETRICEWLADHRKEIK
ncbi:MAG: prolyl oligopeptidase family serine peptidase [Lachnospiraceae bacterium]|nr:prolyl oligopeptidase family serine peptidase [Lachnospiraceae bacterium]